MPLLLALVMGLPASGKTTLCRQLAAALADRRILCLHVCYDALLNDRADWGQPWYAWKADRKLVESSVRRLIGLEAALLDEQFYSAFAASLPATAFSADENVCILLDDNFYLASMRRPFRRMANAAAGVRFALIHAQCSIEVAEERNNGRRVEERVSPSTMKRMSERMERPKRPKSDAENNTLVFNSEGVDAVGKVADWLVEVLHRPPEPPTVVASEQDKLDARLATQLSPLHQVDLALRQAVGELTREHIAEWPECGRRLASAKNSLMRQFQAGRLAASDSDLTALKALLLDTAQAAQCNSPCAVISNRRLVSDGV